MFEQLTYTRTRDRMAWLRWCRPTFHYWMETEVHVYAFSIAANVLLSFFPFLIVMVSLCRYVLHWHGAEAGIYLALADFYPDEVESFIVRNLKATVASRGPFQVFSVLILLFAANGVFEPLEVALNRAWGIRVNRSFLKNQLVSFGLIFACGSLAMLSTILTAANQRIGESLLGQGSGLAWFAGQAAFKIAAVPMSILMLYLIYWLLPNGKVPPTSIIPAAVVIGFALEALKWLNLLLWPFLRQKLRTEYGPFIYSVSIVLVSFFASLIILAGAEWTARTWSEREVAAPATQPEMDPAAGA